MREVSDVRVHSMTGHLSLLRYERETAVFKPLPAKTSFLHWRDLTRLAHADACRQLDISRCSVRWWLIGGAVTGVVVARGMWVAHPF
jgi:hypothetical protein